MKKLDKFFLDFIGKYLNKAILNVSINFSNIFLIQHTVSYYIRYFAFDYILFTCRGKL